MDMTLDEWAALGEAERAGDTEAVRKIYRMLEERERKFKENDIEGIPGEVRDTAN